MRFSGLLCTILLLVATVCHAGPVENAGGEVASQGVTEIRALFDKVRVSVKITTHKVDIGRPSDKYPEKILSSCTYSRFPCSVVDYLEVFVDDASLFVARSVYADLADVNEASLQRKKTGQYELTLVGGDASESYTVNVTFNKKLVSQRALIHNESGQVMQRTTYFASEADSNL